MESSEGLNITVVAAFPRDARGRQPRITSIDMIQICFLMILLTKFFLFLLWSIDYFFIKI